MSYFLMPMVITIKYYYYQYVVYYACVALPIIRYCFDYSLAQIKITLYNPAELFSLMS